MRAPPRSRLLPPSPTAQTHRANPTTRRLLNPSPPSTPPSPPPSLHLSLLSLASDLVRYSECDRHVPGLCQIPGGRHPCHARSV